MTILAPGVAAQLLAAFPAEDDEERPGGRP
jgi:hypothetical protein